MSEFENPDPGDPGPSPLPSPAPPPPAELHPAKPSPSQGDPLWLVLGPQGLRAGWSILLFVMLFFFFVYLFGTLISRVVLGVLHLHPASGTASSAIVNEGALVLGLGVSMAILARIEHRRFWDYYLAGPAILRRFGSGLVSGFTAVSVLVGALTWGGWIRFGAAPHPDLSLLRYACLWAVGFLFVGLSEEGSFRCYLQFTLTRGINFWGALAVVACLSLWNLTQPASQGAGGVYIMAALGIIPCLYLHLQRTAGQGFWQAAWAGSTFFGFIHTGNHGETWIGILAAAAIGFVFCVSVRLTGSAWWAIGCHAAWDWAETYFYGTADSGLVAKGHLLTTTATGNPLWSGGTDGPEGSLLVLPVVVLLLAILLLMYGRQPQAERTAEFDRTMAS